MFADPDPIPDPGPDKKIIKKTWISFKSESGFIFRSIYILYSDQDPVPNPDTSITKKHNKKKPEFLLLSNFSFLLQEIWIRINYLKVYIRIRI
jgi:hypothetical protein